MEQVPKVVGADIEPANSIHPTGDADEEAQSRWNTCDTGPRATMLLLDETRFWHAPRTWLSGAYARPYETSVNRYGVPLSGCAGGYGDGYGDGYGYGYNSHLGMHDFLRCWGPIVNYDDLGHAEAACSEARSAFDHVRCIHAVYNEWEYLRNAANAKVPGEEIFVTINTTDGRFEESHGAHFNLCGARELYDRVFKPGRLWMCQRHVSPECTFLATCTVAAAVVFGQGHVLRLPDGRACYVLSQRAHHTGCLLHSATTIAFQRAVLNTRDEAHADRSLARYHFTLFDPNLAQASLLCRTWFMQAVVAAMEAGYLDPGLIVLDPVEAFRYWSCGFSPSAGGVITEYATVDGRMVSPVDVLESVTNDLEAMYRAGLIPEAIVPDTGRILPVMRRLLAELREGDLYKLARHFDWALRWQLLAGQMDAEGWPLESDEIALTNQLYSHVDKEIGLFWPFQDNGFAERMVDDAEVRRMQDYGPDDTRAYTRNRILEKFGGDVRSCDWSRMTLEIPSRRSRYLGRRVTLRLDVPWRYGKAETGAIIEGARTAEGLCRALAAAGLCVDAEDLETPRGAEPGAGVTALPRLDTQDIPTGWWMPAGEAVDA